MSDNLWTDAFCDMNEIDRDYDKLTLDQKLKVSEIEALLAIGRELSIIQERGIKREQGQRPKDDSPFFRRPILPEIEPVLKINSLSAEDRAEIERCPKCQLGERISVQAGLRSGRPAAR
jgi:hypothetical protein